MAGKHVATPYTDAARDRVEQMFDNLAPTLAGWLRQSDVPLVEIVELADGLIHEASIRVFDALPVGIRSDQFARPDNATQAELAHEQLWVDARIGFRPNPGQTARSA